MRHLNEKHDKLPSHAKVSLHFCCCCCCMVYISKPRYVRKPTLVINLWTDLNAERIVHRQSQFSLSGGCCRDGIANSGGPRPEGSANYDSWCGIMTARPEIMKAAPSRCADRLAPNTPCFWKYNSTVDCVHDYKLIKYTSNILLVGGFSNVPFPNVNGWVYPI